MNEIAERNKFIQKTQTQFRHVSYLSNIRLYVLVNSLSLVLVSRELWVARRCVQ